MTTKRIAIFLAASFLIIFGFFVYLGAFQSVEIENKESGPYHLAFVKHTGSYSDFTKIIKGVQNTMVDNGIKNYHPFGMFFDDPKVVAEANLRSYIGVVVSPGDIEKLLPLVQDQKVHYIKLEKATYASTSFPYKNFVSIFLGIAKVYPAFEEYAQAQNLPKYEYKEQGYEDYFVMEIYQTESIEYRMALPKN